jgi:hypothetical protein
MTSSSSSRPGYRRWTELLQASNKRPLCEVDPKLVQIGSGELAQNVAGDAVLEQFLSVEWRWITARSGLIYQPRGSPVAVSFWASRRRPAAGRPDCGQPRSRFRIDERPTPAHPRMAGRCPSSGDAIGFGAGRMLPGGAGKRFGAERQCQRDQGARADRLPGRDPAAEPRPARGQGIGIRIRCDQPARGLRPALEEAMRGGSREPGHRQWGRSAAVARRCVGAASPQRAWSATRKQVLDRDQSLMMSSPRTRSSSGTRVIMRADRSMAGPRAIGSPSQMGGRG